MVIEILNEYDSELVSLIRESFSENVETINIEEAKKRGVRFLCAKIDNTIVGNVMITTKYDAVKNKTSFYLDYVCVKDSYQNRGIASKLLEEVEALAKRENISKIQLTSNKRREAARYLYQKYRYTIVDTDIFVKTIGE